MPARQTPRPADRRRLLSDCVQEGRTRREALRLDTRAWVFWRHRHRSLRRHSAMRAVCVHRSATCAGCYRRPGGRRAMPVNRSYRRHSCRCRSSRTAPKKLFRAVNIRCYQFDQNDLAEMMFQTGRRHHRRQLDQSRDHRRKCPTDRATPRAYNFAKSLAAIQAVAACRFYRDRNYASRALFFPCSGWCIGHTDTAINALCAIASTMHPIRRLYKT